MVEEGCFYLLASWFYPGLSSLFSLLPPPLWQNNRTFFGHCSTSPTGGRLSATRDKDVPMWQLVEECVIIHQVGCYKAKKRTAPPTYQWRTHGIFTTQTRPAPDFHGIYTPVSFLGSGLGLHWMGHMPTVLGLEACGQGSHPYLQDKTGAERLRKTVLSHAALQRTTPWPAEGLCHSPGRGDNSVRAPVSPAQRTTLQPSQFSHWPDFQFGSG